MEITQSIYPSIETYIGQLETAQIEENRKAELQLLIDYVQKKIDAEEEINLNFICTHNSRRSQFSQLWATVFANIYEIPASCYSGGVEVTACNFRVINTLKRIGFDVAEEADENPHFVITYGEESNLIILFSKLYDDESNPQEAICAVMTCAHADENCPFIPFADARIPVRYEDPKAFDDTPEETTMYAERCRQIATEMKYIFSSINL